MKRGKRLDEAGAAAMLARLAHTHESLEDLLSEAEDRIDELM